MAKKLAEIFNELLKGDPKESDAALENLLNGKEDVTINRDWSFELCEYLSLGAFGLIEAEENLQNVRKAVSAVLDISFLNNDEVIRRTVIVGNMKQQLSKMIIIKD